VDRGVREPDAIDRTSFLLASGLAAIGLLRLMSDVLTDADPAWTHALDGHWLRHFVRAPSDGTWAGDLNVRWFKLLAIPCGLGVAWFLNLLAAGSLGAADAAWARRRVPAVGALALVVTWIELEKSGRGLGVGFQMLPGEHPAWNHVAHGVSALLGWTLARRLRWRRGGRAGSASGRCPEPPGSPRAASDA
jgi:hypothetical protein